MTAREGVLELKLFLYRVEISSSLKRSYQSVLLSRILSPIVPPRRHLLERKQFFFLTPLAKIGVDFTVGIPKMPFDFSGQHSYAGGQRSKLPPLTSPSHGLQSLPKAAQPATKAQVVKKATGEPSAKSSRDPRADVEFCKAFPRGYLTIHTSSEGYLCGLRAVINTMRAMHGSLPCPTIEELQKIASSPTFVQHCKDFGMDNQNDFSADQIGAVLYTWGQRRGLNLRLAYIPKGRYPRLIPHPNDQPTQVVWIYNDGYNLTGIEGAIGHYSGMHPVKVSSAPRAGQPPKQVEGSSTKRKRPSLENEATCPKRHRFNNDPSTDAVRWSTEFPQALTDDLGKNPGTSGNSQTLVTSGFKQCPTNNVLGTANSRPIHGSHKIGHIASGTSFQEQDVGSAAGPAAIKKQPEYDTFARKLLPALKNQYVKKFGPVRDPKHLDDYLQFWFGKFKDDMKKLKQDRNEKRGTPVSSSNPDPEIPGTDRFGRHQRPGQKPTSNIAELHGRKQDQGEKRKRGSTNSDESERNEDEGGSLENQTNDENPNAGDDTSQGRTKRQRTGNTGTLSASSEHNNQKGCPTAKQSQSRSTRLSGTSTFDHGFEAKLTATSHSENKENCDRGADNKNLPDRLSVSSNDLVLSSQGLPKVNFDGSAYKNRPTENPQHAEDASYDPSVLEKQGDSVQNRSSLRSYPVLGAEERRRCFELMNGHEYQAWMLHHFSLYYEKERKIHPGLTEDEFMLDLAWSCFEHHVQLWGHCGPGIVDTCTMPSNPSEAAQPGGKG
ncbi:MAG: hypothetical protein M1812_006758 [Candelaria pacifica]|nr:MAG: hypothetical protein M1812_006758 [Candelaria pacifica]